MEKYKKFLTVGLMSVAIGLGATVSQDAEAITMPMPPVRVSTVATNVAISSSHNAANVAIANSKNSTTKKPATTNEILFIVGGTFLALAGSIGWIVVDSSKKDIKKQISNIREKLFNTSAKSENSTSKNKYTF